MASSTVIWSGGDFKTRFPFAFVSAISPSRGILDFNTIMILGTGGNTSIEIEKTLPIEEGVYYPRCVKGERACPPEDSGGPYGYPYLLEKLQDPKHEEHEEALEWVGDGFDPEEFDLEKVNAELRYLAVFSATAKESRTRRRLSREIWYM